MSDSPLSLLTSSHDRFPFLYHASEDAPLPDNLLDTAHNFLGLTPNPLPGKEHREKNRTRVQVAASDKN
jgi:hypothetical protein